MITELENPGIDTLVKDVQDNARNHWGALLNEPPEAKKLIAELEVAGVFTTGIASDSKRRGSSINCDLYGWDAARELGVIQVRECVFHPRRYNRVRKDYYLIGRVETGEVFAHPIRTVASIAHKLSREDVVKAAEARIWGIPMSKLPQIIRQGDICLIPSRIPSTAVRVPSGQVVQASHRVNAASLWQTPEGELYARGSVKLTHKPGQHPHVVSPKGSYRIVIGYRARTWGFSKPTAD